MVIYLDYFKLGVIIWVALCLLVFFVFAIKSKHFFKTIFLNAFFGLSVLAIINLTSKYSGIYIPINPISVFCASNFSISGICGLLILNLVFV